MAKTIRRVVTGHDENGRAVCISDNHAWANRGKETCLIAFALVDAIDKINGNAT